MSRTAGEALVLTALPHGEHGAVVRFLDAGRGLVAGYVAGGRGSRRRAVIAAGNRVALTLSGRDGLLPQAAVELVESRALIAFSPGPAAALAWLTALTAGALAEGVPHPRLADALDGLLGALAAGLDGAALRGEVARYELLLLAEEGLGLDLASCALGGPADDLAYVSPKTGRAVSRAKAAGTAWEEKLLPLPAYLARGGPADAAGAAAALALSGHFLWGHWAHLAPRLGPLRRRMIGTDGEHFPKGAAPDKAGG